MKHISLVIAELMGRGELPANVVMVKSLGPARAGDVATWDADLMGYRLRRDPEWIVLADEVRRRWGHYFARTTVEIQTCLL